MKRGLVLLLASLLAATVAATQGFAAGAAAGAVAPAVFDGLVIGVPSLAIAGGKTVITVEMLTQGKKMKLSTQAMEADTAKAVAATLVKGNLVDYRMADGLVLVAGNPSGTFNMILAKDAKDTGPMAMKFGPAQFDSMKYGPEMSPDNGVAGNMVAAGWIYGKTGGTITVGDGRIVSEDIAGRALPKPVKRYEEVYNLARDVAVYNVNTADYSSSSVSDLASLPVTPDYNYATTKRPAAYVVFDKNYREAASAKAVSVYYFTPLSVSDGRPVWDVPTQSYLLKDKGIDPVSRKTYVSILATGVAEAPYTRSTEPFEIVKNTFWFVGDNEVAVYLFAADMGTADMADDRLIMLDAGWVNSGYQYWKNIEAVGFDPRKVTDIMLTHGHADHYGTAMELVTMIENSGGSVRMFGTAEDTYGISVDALGNLWNIKGALPDVETEIRRRTIPYTYDRYMDFGNVQILVTPTPGHTPGTGSFIFRTKNPDTGAWLSFGYMGGYGYNGLYTPTADNGYLRLSFQLGLAWLQQMVDVDYVAPQHTNQYPIVEVYQALKAYNNDPANSGKPLTMLDAMTKNEFINFCEKRYSVATNALSDLKDKRYKSIETSGPFKPWREYGLHEVKATLLDGGKIIQGFNGFQNVVPQIPLLKNGIQIITDSYTHDPEGWYVQFFIDVLDGYGGFLPGSGPVESYRPTPGAPEILRTQRLGSRAEAEAILKTVHKGGTYYIDLTKASAIIVPKNIVGTFKEVK